MHIVGVSALADLIGESQEAVRCWLDEGIPVAGSADTESVTEFESAAVIEWLHRRNCERADLQDPKERLARLQADRVQIDIDVKRGRLVNVDEIEPRVIQAVISAREQLRNEPDRLAFALAATDGAEAKAELIAQSFEDFVQRLRDANEFFNQVHPGPPTTLERRSR